ncbi:hypothetical protein CK203_115450 [Vitis vinifera]|uniref:Uncharacterized protein n=1 Tax=Vitis vinifera TaxID=29760 RepID=A0A438BL79_VITVI|nr:hypothetical protein CK203_115450 [Vitis vinifera]
MNFMSYEHLVEKCPIIPVVREMFGDCNTYNSNWRDHPNFSWKPQPPQYKQPTQAPQQASNLEQAMVNLSKKIDNLQDSISRFANLNTVQEKGNLPSQPYKNSKGIHEVEAKKGESSMVKEVKTVITLSGGIAKMMKEKEEKREFWPLVLLPLWDIFSLWDIFWSTSSSPFYTYYIPFRSSGSHESSASNGVQIGVETKKLWSLQENWTELSGNFAHLNSRNPVLQTVYDLDLKRRSYGRLKTTMQS